MPLERYPHLSVSREPDPRRLPFDDETFDAVLSCGVLEHVEDPDASLEEIRRVLAPGGTFYVYKLPNRTSYLEAIARRTGLYYHGAYEHDRVYTAAERDAAADPPRLRGSSEVRRMNMLPLTLTGRVAARAAPSRSGRSTARSARSRAVNLLATNVELVARDQPR